MEYAVINGLIYGCIAFILGLIGVLTIQIYTLKSAIVLSVMLFIVGFVGGLIEKRFKK
mgnify:CR=1 FL=1